MRSFVLLCVLVACASAITDKQYRELVDYIQVAYPRMNTSDAIGYADLLIKYEDELVNAPAPKPMAVPSCPTFAPPPPATTVAGLHPSDIQLLGALGDSVTCASNALSTTWFNLKQYPGISWSMGADNGALTFPNMLKQFSPNVQGMSTGTGDGVRNANAAVGGSVVQDVLGQIPNMVANWKRLNSNYLNVWKMVTVFIGANNLCVVCKSTSDKNANNGEVFESYMRAVLNELWEIPNLVINLVSGMDYTQLHQFKGPFCGLALGFVCPCCTTSNSGDQATVLEINAQYNAAITALVAEFNNGSRSDWVVVEQPFLDDSIIVDDSYLSTADCFHPSGSGQALFATGLWNNVITPVGQKATAVAPSTTVICPTANTLIYNAYNS